MYHFPLAIYITTSLACTVSEIGY